MEDVIEKWIKFRKTCIEIMDVEKRKKLFPETLEDGYSWEAGGLADYIRVHMPSAPDACHVCNGSGLDFTLGQAGTCNTCGGTGILR